MKAYPVRVFVGVVFAAVVWFTPMFGSDGNFPLMYYLIIIGIFMLHQVRAYVHTYVVAFLLLSAVCVRAFFYCQSRASFNRCCSSISCPHMLNQPSYTDLCLTCCYNRKLIKWILEAPYVNLFS